MSAPTHIYTLAAALQADRNNDGKVDYNEFCNLMRTSMTKREI